MLMPRIIDLEDRREVWLACECLCVSCSHKWDAVIHKNRQTKLECPECRLLLGAVVHVYNEKINYA